MDELLAQVPPKSRDRFREIVALTDDFCARHLDAQYRAICRVVAAACAEGVPVTSGKAAGWAAGVVAAVGFVNFLGDPSQPHHMTNEEMAAGIGVSPARLHSKAKAIRDALGIRRMDTRFSTAKMIDENPMVWMIEFDGMIYDLRQESRAVQEAAFRKGLIPYIPADAGGPSGGS